MIDSLYKKNRPGGASANSSRDWNRKFPWHDTMKKLKKSLSENKPYLFDLIKFIRSYFSF